VLLIPTRWQGYDKPPALAAGSMTVYEAALPVKRTACYRACYRPSRVAQQPREGGAKTRHDIFAVQRIAGAESRGGTHRAHVGP